jgi:hypothetical protein
MIAFLCFLLVALIFLQSPFLQKLLGAIMTPTSPLGSRLRILGQPVGELNPLHLAARIDLVARRHGFGMIEAAGRDVDLIGIVVGLKRQLVCRGGSIRA